jgi:hypothetical protein
MKQILATLLYLTLIHSSKTESKIYVDSCGTKFIISEQDYYYDSGRWWSKGKVNWKDGQVVLSGITIYDTIVKHIQPDGKDSLFKKADFIPIISLDSIANRTHTRDISQVACCGRQLDSLVLRLDIVSKSIMVRAKSFNKECDTLKLKITEPNNK